MKTRTFNLLLTLVISLGVVCAAVAQEPPAEALTQEQFAVDLVRIMELEHLLPRAALPSDCVNVLNSLGIAPLGGWKNKEFLNREDYFVIIGKAQGRERVVHKRAVDVETLNVRIINQKWDQAYKDTGRWPELDDLLNDPKYFPKGSPKSPYNIKYKDKNGDHRVDPIFLPAAELQDVLKTLTTEN